MKQLNYLEINKLSKKQNITKIMIVLQFFCKNNKIYSLKN